MKNQLIMKTKRNYLLIPILCFILSCSSDPNLNTTNLDHSTIEGRNTCLDEQTDRLAVNEDFSVVISHCYDQGILSSVEYEISERQPDDKISSLDLSEGAINPVIHILNDQIDNLNYSGEIYRSENTVGHDDDSCECKDTDPEVVDCKVRTWNKVKYCDGTLCSTCSLIMVFLLDSGYSETVTTSSIILPTNF